MPFSPPFHLRRLNRSDFCSPLVFQEHKALIWQHLSSEKKIRQVFLNAHCQLLFESAFLVWFQIQEMLRVEPNADLEEELQVYEPLIPTPSRLTFTLMFEFPDVQERHQKLADLAGFEKKLSLHFAEHTITAQELDAQETTEKNKASAVNFLFFPLSPTQIHDFCLAETAQVISTHPVCQSVTTLPLSLLNTLQKERLIEEDPNA